jgi:hypothetical protein
MSDTTPEPDQAALDAEIASTCEAGPEYAGTRPSPTAEPQPDVQAL